MSQPFEACGCSHIRHQQDVVGHPENPGRGAPGFGTHKAFRPEISSLVPFSHMPTLLSASERAFLLIPLYYVYITIALRGTFFVLLFWVDVPGISWEPLLRTFRRMGASFNDMS